MDIAKAVATRGTCDRGRIGCVIVKDKRLLSTGYVGSPIGLPHCDEVGHQMKKVSHEDGRETNHCLRTSHAEVNAVALAARNGVSIDGGTLYIMMVPCYTCSKMLINSGIKRVVAEKDYHDSKDTKELFKSAGIELVLLNKEVVGYTNQ